MNNYKTDMAILKDTIEHFGVDKATSITPSMLQLIVDMLFNNKYFDLGVFVEDMTPVEFEDFICNNIYN